MAKIKNAKDLSLVELAKRIVEESKTPIVILDLINKTLKEKGVSPTPEVISELYQGILINGAFIVLLDPKGKQCISLKSRQSAEVLDKENNYIEDLLEDDEEVVNNVLTNDSLSLGQDVESALEQMNSDEAEEEEKEETDEIAEELGLVDAEDMSEDEAFINDDDEEVEEAESDDLEDIEGELKFNPNSNEGK